MFLRIQQNQASGSVVRGRNFFGKNCPLNTLKYEGEGNHVSPRLGDGGGRVLDSPDAPVPPMIPAAGVGSGA